MGKNITLNKSMDVEHLIKWNLEEIANSASIGETQGRLMVAC